ncbi:hypothetical protein O0I10_011107 [Lichtheimia ornata]|uniref:Zn(2)-C6 fungal-type domain-containing protein n=1 Tax=Lichtheimia ornata TaxID=688661 RepID=A0AAD7UTF5_9FUNG|nr:uncharacterized protein O0I10_011107 [Lichtheimia ornata]KAJ8653259.1 hypothetical protein O0I10_011107 [Lichtheimia ornata]
MSPKGKNVPCEGCRERKKKCSSGQPCERCKRLGIECHYLKPAAPPDLEYVDLVNSHELEANVDELERLMTDMEGELLRVQQHGFDTANIMNGSSDDSIPPAMTTDSPFSSASTPTSDGVASPPELSVIRSRQQPTTEKTFSPNWKVTLGKYGFSIETDIRSYDDLLQQVQLFSTTISIPLLKQPSSTDPQLIPRYTLPTLLRRAHYQASKRCMLLSEDQSPSPSSIIINNDLVNAINYNLATHLLEAYFSCQFYRTIILHRNTFYSLFVTNKDLYSSSVVSSFCAAILTLRCRHVQSTIPYEQQRQLQNLYYSRAHDLIEQSFDEPTLDTFMTYLFMAYYHSNLTRPKEARQYLDFGLRIRELIDDRYMSPDCDNNERELYKRLHVLISIIARKIEFLNNQRGIPLKVKRPIRVMNVEVCKRIRSARYQATPLPGESFHVERAIMKDKFGAGINKILGPYLNHTRLSQDPVPLSLLVKTESALNQYCFKDIPTTYRLSLNIFENDISDSEFRHRLNNDKSTDPSTVTLAIRYYQALITIHEPFLPTLPPEFRTNAFDTEEVTPSIIEPPTLEADKRDRFTMRALEVCYRSAVIITRLFEYLVLQESICCETLMPLLLSAWDIHVRNACLGFADPEKAQKHVPIRVVKASRDYVMRCICVLRKGYCYNAADRAMWEHHQNMENELLQALFATRPYTAEYWDPWSSTAAW